MLTVLLLGVVGIVTLVTTGLYVADRVHVSERFAGDDTTLKLLSAHSTCATTPGSIPGTWACRSIPGRCATRIPGS